MDARGLIQQTLGEPVRTMVPLEGGCVARVWRVRTETGRDLIAKCATDDSDGGFVDEAAMLDRLRRVAPTPEVIASRHGLLLMEYVEHDGAASTAGERELGGIVARIHGVRGDRYGFGCPTRIRQIRFENGWSDDWGAFLTGTRLLPAARMASQQSLVPPAFVRDIETLCANIGRVLGRPDGPSLVHGDLWSGNVLWSAGRPAALIDPLSLYADPEMELAFIDLMGGVSQPFWDGYESVRPIRDGFREVRMHLYQIVPLLVHAVLFGQGYGGHAVAALQRVRSGIGSIN